MQIYEELKARGLIAQVTSEDEIRELIAKLETTKSDMTIYDSAMPMADAIEMLAIEMSIKNLKWVLEDTDER